jgi:hypothetical protein
VIWRDIIGQRPLIWPVRAWCYQQRGIELNRGGIVDARAWPDHSINHVLVSRTNQVSDMRVRSRTRRSIDFKCDVVSQNCASSKCKCWGHQNVWSSRGGPNPRLGLSLLQAPHLCQQLSRSNWVRDACSGWLADSPQSFDPLQFAEPLMRNATPTPIRNGRYKHTFSTACAPCQI